MPVGFYSFFYFFLRLRVLFGVDDFIGGQTVEDVELELEVVAGGRRGDPRHLKWLLSKLKQTEENCPKLLIDPNKGGGDGLSRCCRDFRPS